MTDKNDSKAHKKDGQRIFNTRAELGLTQQKMAEKFGCSLRTYRNYERAITTAPLEFRRDVAEASGLDIHPIDPEVDPFLLIVQSRELKEAANSSPTSEHDLKKQSLWTRIRRFRASSQEYCRNGITPLRRWFENAVFTAQLTSSFVLAIELFQRSIGGWQTHQVYHDTLLFTSALTAVCLFFPTALTIPWGIKSVKC
ncbi:MULTISPECIES: helix-turn-helix transcriptional regulator [unclassified Ruegeria]|uniref:helix-turn-helix domain-containing protein n=1 Tax=unclassified Ruegeria TaxID=2625375 RepID=UPI001ADB8CE7|nr:MULTISPECIES: helix-turn-helix transcriptional regulator [unclassified Ruegeria]MBO9410758.1 helix-turn-helix transcriptional regulator [Ruegeria sp. R8_1]MBO9414959.1 helix-turn-helix transcriptional regulator [Ruegeria sp. R8_2]